VSDTILFSLFLLGNAVHDSAVDTLQLIQFIQKSYVSHQLRVLFFVKLYFFSCLGILMALMVICKGCNERSSAH